MNKILLVLLAVCFFSGARSQTVDFTFQSTNGLYCTPSSIQFTQACTGNPISFTWDFGNSQQGYNGIETATYNAPGTYTVKLTATFSNSILSKSKTIIINPGIKAFISADKDSICLPGDINFTGSGSGSIANYEWNFGDGTALENTSTPGIKHTFSGFGSDTVMLRATDAAGCYADTTFIISISNPAITGTATPSRGCTPVNAIFTASVPYNLTVTSFTWDYGDGSTPEVTTANNTSHNYTLRGVFTPRLQVTTSEGCTGTYSFPVVGYGSLQDNAIVYAKNDTICGSDYAVLVSKGTNANKYIWNFGDNSSVTTTDTVVAHRYRKLGTKTIAVAPYDNGCIGATVRTSVTVIGVIAGYKVSNTCSDKDTYSFVDTSEGNVSGSLWDFAHGSPQSNIDSPFHTYPSSGQFLSSLVVHDDITGCSDTATQTVYTAVPQLTGAGTTVCKNDSVNFSLVNNYTDTNSVYYWNVLGSRIGPDSSAAITVSNNTPGNYNNFVVIDRGPRFCLDTVVAAGTVISRGTDLNFDSPANICLNTPLMVTNRSQPFVATDTVKFYYWNFGNLVSNDSNYQPAPYQYDKPGRYIIRLTSVNIFGCIDTLTRPVNIDPAPFLLIIPKTAFVCLGQSDTLVALNDASVTWSPAGGLTCTSCDTVVATPPASAKYYATATNIFNCSTRDSSYVEVAMPFTVSPVPGYASICSNKTTTLDALPKGKKILWSPAAGLSDATAYNPVAAPLQTTTYTATLTDSAGCFSRTTSFIVNVNPLPVADAGPDKFYPKGASFSITPVYSNNIMAYSWTPPDLLSCSTCAAPAGVANFTQQYIIKVTSDSGCIATDSVVIHTECKSSDLYMPTAFTPNNDGLNDFYYPLTNNFKTISAFTIFNRQGKIVFSGTNFPANDKSFGWDGRYQGKEQSADTYVYILEAACDAGQKFFLEGSFVLIK